MLRKFTLAAGAIALLTGTAFAQMPMGMTFKENTKQLTPEQREKQKALDDAYKEATKKIPEKNAANDPWSGVRPNPSTAKAGQ